MGVYIARKTTQTQASTTETRKVPEGKISQHPQHHIQVLQCKFQHAHFPAEKLVDKLELTRDKDWLQQREHSAFCHLDFVEVGFHPEEWETSEEEEDQSQHESSGTKLNLLIAPSIADYMNCHS